MPADQRTKYCTKVVGPNAKILYHSPLVGPGWTLVLAPRPSFNFRLPWNIENEAGMLTGAAELKPDTLYGRCRLKCPASIRPQRVESPPFRLSGENTTEIFSLGSSVG